MNGVKEEPASEAATKPKRGRKAPAAKVNGDVQVGDAGNGDVESKPQRGRKTQPVKKEEEAEEAVFEA